MTLRLLTWPARPHYLRYLACLPHDLYVVVSSSRDFFGSGWHWPDNVHPVTEEVRRLPLGYVDTNPSELVARMRELLASPGEAWRLAHGARRAARERFDLRRFARDWDHALRSVAGTRVLAATSATRVGA